MCSVHIVIFQQEYIYMTKPFRHQAYYVELMVLYSGEKLFKDAFIKHCVYMMSLMHSVCPPYEPVVAN